MEWPKTFVNGNNSLKHDLLLPPYHWNSIDGREPSINVWDCLRNMCNKYEVPDLFPDCQPCIETSVHALSKRAESSPCFEISNWTLRRCNQMYHNCLINYVWTMWWNSDLRFVSDKLSNSAATQYSTLMFEKQEMLPLCLTNAIFFAKYKKLHHAIIFICVKHQ